MHLRNLVAVAVILLVAPLAAASQGVRVILVRHAEAEAKGSDPALTLAGEARARCLAEATRGMGITHVFASPKLRARQTAQAVASSLGLRVQERDPLDADALAKELLALPPGSVALVAGHSNTVPALAKALGTQLEDLTEEAGQRAIPRDEYDRMVVLRLRPDRPKNLRLVDVNERRYACDKRDW